MLQLIQNHVFILSAVAMTISAIVNLAYAYIARINGSMFLHYIAVSILSLLYVVSYILFLTDVWSRLYWSEVMIVPSLLSIILVWVAPAVHMLSETRGLKKG